MLSCGSCMQQRLSSFMLIALCDSKTQGSKTSHMVLLEEDFGDLDMHAYKGIDRHAPWFVNCMQHVTTCGLTLLKQLC